MHCVVRFPAQWINASRFEWALRNSCGPHDANTFEITFEFPSGCKVMVDAAIRLLSLVNQLASTTRRVQLNFEEGEAGTMGYLNRMGFFDHLADAVEVFPSRPFYSSAELHRGGNAALVEIARINKDARDEELPTRLTEALMMSCHARPDAAELKGAAWTIFAELIDNIFSHSGTELDGYAALQVYSLAATDFPLRSRTVGSASWRRCVRRSAPNSRIWSAYRTRTFWWKCFDRVCRGMAATAVAV